MRPKLRTLLFYFLWIVVSILIYVFSNPIGRLIELAQAQKLSSEHGLQSGETFDLGALVSEPQHLLIKIKINFRLDPVYNKLGFPNLFQTDDVNSGIRVELSGNTLAVIVARDAGSSSPRGIIITRRMRPETDYLLELQAETESGLSIRLNGNTIEVDDPQISFSLQNLRIGVGFDDNRKFVGPIERWELLYQNRAVGYARYVEQFSLISLLAGIMLLSCRFVIIWKPWRSGWSWRQATIGLRDVYHRIGTILFTSRNRSLTAILAAVSPILGIIYTIASAEFTKSAIALRSKLLPGMLIAKGAALFKDELVALAVVQLGFVLVISAGFLLTYKAIQLKGGVGIRSISLILFLDLAAILICLVIGTISRIAFGFFGLSILLTGSLLIRTEYFTSVKSVVAKRSSSSEGSSGPATEDNGIRFLKRLGHAVTFGERYRWLLLASLILACTIVTAPLLSAWFPLTMPNDYMEISDNFSGLSTSGGPLPRSQVAACLRALNAGGEAEPDCDKMRGIEQELSQDIASSSGWQGEPGRILFHHSYIYVPAAHLLKYGFDRNLPFLYGVGNTAAHAVVMWLAGGATLSSYFNTVPILELFGILSIAVLVLYATRSAMLFLLSYLIALACLYSVHFTAAFLAISFSPLRYFGLIVQIASIIFVARNNTKVSALVLIFAACFSLFWNKEFAILGLLGQGLWLLGSHSMGILQRVIILVAMFASLVAATILSGSPESISTVTLAFYNVWNPIMIPSEKLVFILLLVGGQICLMYLSRLAESPSQPVLLSIVPVIGCLFVKYAFNPSPPHLCFVFILVAPIVLIFVPWTRMAPFSRALLILPAFVSVIAYTVFVSSEYLDESDADRQTLMRPFASEPWSRLGETINFVTPEADIVGRVSAIKALNSKFDRILWLSPLDHLLSFYVNPPMFCGHFEVMTNVATPAIQEQLENCGARPGTLIVYDKAITTPCPTDPLESHSRCAARAAMKSNLDQIMHSLAPRVQWIAETPDLIFYMAR